METKRGISPVVATVLLIVVVIALFLLIFLWLKGFQKEAILKNGTPIETQCTAIRFDATYTLPSLQVSNTASTTINKIQVLVDGSSKTNTGTISPATSTTADLSQWCKTGKKIKLIPYLLGQTKSGAQKEYACTNQAKTISC